jgi:hypothetical protein
MCLIVVYTTNRYDKPAKRNNYDCKTENESTIQIAYSDYCLGCMQELRTILSSTSISKEGVSC